MKTHGKRILFLVTEDWYFAAHRLPLARAAREAGYEVVVATRVREHGEVIEREGFRLEPLEWSRSTRSPLGVARELGRVVALYRRVQPDILHHVSLKPIVLGSLALRFVGARPSVNAFTGLGHAFTSDRAAMRATAALASKVLSRTLNRPSTLTLLENEDDRRHVMKRFRLPPERTAVNRGSGVDTSLFRPMPLPESDAPVVACCSRMLASKGIADLVAASRILRERGIAHKLVLAGNPDPENPQTIPEATLREWASADALDWVGHVEDVRRVWAEADIAVLASHGGEGVPLSLVEAAACGRPLVATDVPGCRDIVQDGLNGLLAPPRDPAALADRLERLLTDSRMRKAMSAASPEVVEMGFSSTVVTARTLALYEGLLAGCRAEAPASG